MTVVRGGMSAHADKKFSEYTNGQGIFNFVNETAGYENLSVIFVTYPSVKNDPTSTPLPTVLEAYVLLPQSTHDAFSESYLDGGTEALYDDLTSRLKDAGFAKDHVTLTSLEAVFTDYEQWKNHGAQLRIICNIHDVENLGTVRDFYRQYIEALGTALNLKPLGEE